MVSSWMASKSLKYLAIVGGLTLIGLYGAVAAQRLPPAKPRPSLTAAAGPVSDPIGELLKQQALENPQGPLPVVIGFDLQETQGRSRLTLEVSDPVDIKAFTVTNPNRVVFDMPEVLWRLQGEARPSGRGAVRSYRYGVFRKGDSRFVIDLNQPVKVGTPQLLQPERGMSFRLVIDLTPTTTEAFAAQAGWPKDTAQPPAASLAPPPTAVPQPLGAGKRTIVVDAGHGGIDPGTHGTTGLREKDVVLAVAKKLREALEATGRYRVQLTRDTDIFIPLRGRVTLARAAHGDLFVSLHADSNDHRDIRGASVYTLSEESSDREAAKLAEKENMSDVIAGVDLTGENSPVATILIDLAQRETMNRSARFAETILSLLPTATMVRPTSPHRAAGFAVLKAPDVPAVLIELGYLTNTKDESEMATETWRARVAQALTSAIDVHFAAGGGLSARQAANP
jgi:N-acetylmuramoyl-L-alanine amidase